MNVSTVPYINTTGDSYNSYTTEGIQHCYQHYPLMCTTRLLVDWTDAPADWNGLVRFAERWNLVSARVSSHITRNLIQSHAITQRSRYGSPFWHHFSELNTDDKQQNGTDCSVMIITEHEPRQIGYKENDVPCIWTWNKYLLIQKYLSDAPLYLTFPSSSIQSTNKNTMCIGRHL